MHGAACPFFSYSFIPNHSNTFLLHATEGDYAIVALMNWLTLYQDTVLCRPRHRIRHPRVLELARVSDQAF